MKGGMIEMTTADPLTLVLAAFTMYAFVFFFSPSRDNFINKKNNNI